MVLIAPLPFNPLSVLSLAAQDLMFSAGGVAEDVLLRSLIRIPHIAIQTEDEKDAGEPDLGFCRRIF
jgi:hypothetical protein